jgi:hypothetical protein
MPIVAFVQLLLEMWQYFDDRILCQCNNYLDIYGTNGYYYNYCT